MMFHPIVWLKRIRHRCGYGVHSPFAYNFLTQVIYEKGIYYAYNELPKKDIKLNRLLFRLTNYAQPKTIVLGGNIPDISKEYIHSAKKAAKITTISNETDWNTMNVDFLYVNCYKNIELLNSYIEKALPHVNKKSLFIIQGIKYNKSMREWWKNIKKNDKIGITFDLYDLGIIFFDKGKNKQSYIINF